MVVAHAGPFHLAKTPAAGAQGKSLMALHARLNLKSHLVKLCSDAGTRAAIISIDAKGNRRVDAEEGRYFGQSCFKGDRAAIGE